MNYYSLGCAIVLLILIAVISYFYFFKRYLTKLRYDRIQTRLKAQVEFDDVVSDMASTIQMVGGVDISFIINNSVDACISMVILDIETLEVVYSMTEWIKLTSEYIPGYLAFREAPHIHALLTKLKESTDKGWYPDVLMVDGNGRLHPKEFGLACHVGVIADIPCIGVAKNLFQMGDIIRDSEHKEKSNGLVNAGDSFDIHGAEGAVIGAAVKGCKKASKPIYVSQGHKVSLETAIEVVAKCSNYRVPEPVRQADMMSRHEIRRYHETGEVSSRGGCLHNAGYEVKYWDRLAQSNIGLPLDYYCR